jgi:hypothetical protein
MITLKPPPILARKVLHLNSPSSSSGGKDYVLVSMNNGEYWAINGPANNVRNGGGAVQHPSKSWSEMVSEKSSKGYTVIGEYQNGDWSSWIGETYRNVPNIPVRPSAVSAPIPEPDQPKRPVAVKPAAPLPLTKQYPVSKKVLDAFGSGNSNGWFHIRP